METTSVYKRILVPLDGSDQSEQALSTAIHLARLASGTLLLLRTIPTRHPSAEEREAVLAYLKRVVAEADVADAPDAPGAAGGAVEYLVVAGSPGSAVVQAAHEHAADLIGLVPRVSCVCRRVLVGSVATPIMTRVMHASPVPLLVLPRHNVLLPSPHAEAGGRQATFRALVALDGSASMERAASASARLLWSLIGPSVRIGENAAVVHMHLVRMVDLSGLLWETSFNTRRGQSDRSIAKKTASMRADAEEYLRAAAERIRAHVGLQAAADLSLAVTWAAPTGLDVAATLVESARSVIARFTAEDYAQLGPCLFISVATQRHSSWRRRVLGSTINQIMQSADMPTLVVPISAEDTGKAEDLAAHERNQYMADG